MVGLKNIMLESKTEDFIEKLASQGGQPIYKLSPTDARLLLEQIQSENIDKPQVKIEDRKILAGAQGEISIRIFRPQYYEGLLPVTMFFHGAGWVMGSANTHDRLARELAFGSHSAVVFVNYSRSPEARFPVAIEEAYAATKYIAENSQEFDFDCSHLAIVGDSVGANIAIAVTLLAKERSAPKIDFQVLFYPVTNADLTSHSYEEFADGPWLTKASMEWFWNAYEPSSSARKNPLMSPLQASIDQLKGLPPALIITDENDVLRDEGEAFAHRLMQAQVEVTAMRFLGTVHDFVMLHGLAHTPATRGAIALANTYLHQTFYKK